MVFGLTEIFEQSQKNLFDFGAKADEPTTVVLNRGRVPGRGVTALLQSPRSPAWPG